MLVVVRVPLVGLVAEVMVQEPEVVLVAVELVRVPVQSFRLGGMVVLALLVGLFAVVFVLVPEPGVGLVVAVVVVRVPVAELDAVEAVRVPSVGLVVYFYGQAQRVRTHMGVCAKFHIQYTISI